jgi:predicted RNA-binding Zn-ribbon protein involved in translation (DUF1610 family)
VPEIPGGLSQGDPVRDRDLRGEFKRPSLLIYGENDPVPKEDPMLHSVRFSPGKHPDELGSLLYDGLYSEAFWRSYGEPIGEMVVAAHLLCFALKEIRWAQAVREGSDAPPEGTDPELAWERGLSSLNQLASSAGPQLGYLPSGKLVQTWRTPSLLASLAVMAQVDLAGSSNMRECTACGRLFTSRSHAVTYCSPRCRGTALKRRYRRRTKENAAQA